MTYVPDYPRQDRRAGLARTVIGDRRPTRYEPQVALRIVEQVANGELLKDICVDGSGLPAKTTFLQWCARVPELANAFRSAKEISAFVFEEEALDTARMVMKKSGTTQQLRAAEIAIGQLRWSAERRDPKSYGSKSSVSVVVPVQINTSLDLGQGSQSELPDIYTLDLKAQPASDSERGILDTDPEPQDPPVKRELKPRMSMDAPTPLPPRKRNAFLKALKAAENEPVTEPAAKPV